MQFNQNCFEETYSLCEGRFLSPLPDGLDPLSSPALPILPPPHSLDPPPPPPPLGTPWCLNLFFFRFRAAILVFENSSSDLLSDNSRCLAVSIV